MWGDITVPVDILDGVIRDPVWIGLIPSKLILGFFPYKLNWVFVVQFIVGWLFWFLLIVLSVLIIKNLGGLKKLDSLN